MSTTTWRLTGNIWGCHCQSVSNWHRSSLISLSWLDFFFWNLLFHSICLVWIGLDWNTLNSGVFKHNIWVSSLSFKALLQGVRWSCLSTPNSREINNITEALHYNDIVLQRHRSYSVASWDRGITILCGTVASLYSIVCITILYGIMASLYFMHRIYFYDLIFVDRHYSLAFVHF